MSEPEAEIITSKTEIMAILQRVVTERLFVSVRLPGSTKEYTSTILQVNPETGLFALDELFPSDGDQLLHRNPRLELHARINGAEVDIVSRVDGFGRDEQGMAYYRVVFPQQVRYLQRRASYRVEADRLSEMPVHLMASESPDAAPVQGVLHDISGGGFSAWLLKGDAEAVESWDMLDRCRIEIDKDESLEADVVIRGARFVESRNRYIVGGEFVADDPRLRNRVNRIVANLERRILRRKSAAPLR